MYALAGAYDIHVHAAPSTIARKYSALEAMRLADQAGLAGIMLLDHSTMTADLAYILNEMGFRTRAYGMIMLNGPVGGLNVAAADAAVAMGARVVSMPTFSSAHHAAVYGADAKLFPDHLHVTFSDLTVADENGRVRAEVEAILDVVAGADVTLATGHLSATEINLLAGRARERGVRRVLINSVSTDILDLEPDDQRELARNETVFFEHDHVVLTSIPHVRTPIERVVAGIRAVGPERCVIGTDSGQPPNLDLVAAMQQFCDLLLQQGLSERDLDLMVRTNPRILLEGN